jgi:hypothetical protein
MNSSVLALDYKRYGFVPFPLSPKTKVPPAMATFTTIADRAVMPDDNIGLFTGSKNGFVVIDADSSESRLSVTDKLRGMGILDWCSVVRTPKKGGLHFWLRVLDVPATVQAYYKLPPSLGSGEFRLRHPAYVVAPGSVLPEGEYVFVQGGIAQFVEQPAVLWADLVPWLLPNFNNTRPVQVSMDDPRLAGIKYEPQPKIIALLESMKHPDKAGRVRKVSHYTGAPVDAWFASRSEAEMSLVTGLVCAGWSFEQVHTLFNEQRPAHYMSTPHRATYLRKTYDKAVSFVLSRKG